MSDTLMQHYLKSLRLPTFLKEYKQTGQACLEEGASYTDYLKRLNEKEYLNRQDKAIQHKIKKARFPTLKTLDMFALKLFLASINH